MVESAELLVRTFFEDLKEMSKEDVYFEWPARELRKAIKALLELPTEEAKERLSKCFPEGYSK